MPEEIRSTEEIVEDLRKATRTERGLKRLDEVDPDGRMTLASLEERGEKLGPSLTAALEHARRLVLDEADRGMLLLGSPGIGKTHLMVGLAREILGTGRGVYWANMLTLVAEIQASYSDEDGPSRMMIMKKIINHPVVMLDDLGKERSSEDVDGILYELIDGLDRGKRTLIVSTNMDLETYAARYDEATRSRIKGMCKRLLIKGDDMRRESGRYRD